MDSATLTKSEIKRLLILYRTIVHYPKSAQSSVQNVIRFLFPRIPNKYLRWNQEVKEAWDWWKSETTKEQRRILKIQYLFVAKEF